MIDKKDQNIVICSIIYYTLAGTERFPFYLYYIILSHFDTFGWKQHVFGAAFVKRNCNC